MFKLKDSQNRRTPELLAYGFICQKVFERIVFKKLMVLWKKKVFILPHQWCIQRLSDAGIPVWVPKLSAQIKGELMENNISHLIMSSMQMRLHVFRHLI